MSKSVISTYNFKTVTSDTFIYLSIYLSIYLPIYKLSVYYVYIIYLYIYVYTYIYTDF